MPKAHKWVNPTFEHQADAVLNQVNPVSGTPYEVLATTRNVRIIGIYAEVDWTVQPTPLEVHITIDGNTITHFIDNPISGTFYFAFMNWERAETAQSFNTSGTGQYRAFLWEGRSVRITAEITGGTVQLLQCRVKYAIIPDA